MFQSTNSKPVARASVLAIASVLLLAASSYATDPIRDDPARSTVLAERVASVLRERGRALASVLSTEGEGATGESTAALKLHSLAASAGHELAGLGQEALPALFDALVVRSPGSPPPIMLPSHAPGTTSNLTSGTTLNLTSDTTVGTTPGMTVGTATSTSNSPINSANSADFEREALISGLCELPMFIVRSHVERIVAHGASTALRCAALDVFCRKASAAEIELCTVIARPISDDASIDPAVASAFEHTIGAVLLRDHGAYGPLDVLLHAMPDETAAVVFRAVAATQSRDGLTFLARQLDREPRFATGVMAEIQRMGMHADRPVDAEVLATVRARALDPQSPVLDEALLAAGWLDDFEAIPALIGYLRDHRAGVRADALWSLQRMTGLRLACEPEMWSRWHATEVEWWHDDAQRLFVDLRATNSGHVKAALIAIAPVRTFRHRIAAEIVPLLSNQNLEVATVAARILSQVRSPVAVPALIRSLDREEKDLRLASWNALKEITAQSLPADARAWRSRFPAQ